LKIARPSASTRSSQAPSVSLRRARRRKR
jgi:hypothetical protein